MRLVTGGKSGDRSVVFVVHPPGAVGGIASFTDQLVRRTSGQAAVTTIAFRHLYPAFTTPGREERARVGRRRATGPVPYLPWTWLLALRSVGGASLVVIQWWHPGLAPFLLALSRATRRRGGRLLVVCHNAVPHERFPFARCLTSLALRRADRVCTLSAHVAAEVRSLAPSVDVEVLSHPPNLDLEHAAGTDSSRPPAPVELPTAFAGRPVLLFFGHVRPYKGLEDLIDALPLMSTTPPAVLVVAGRFYQPIGRIREHIRRLGLTDRVHLVDGYVDDDAVPALFASADLVVLPYRTASQSGVLSLAARFSRPVVATTAGSLPDDVGDSGVLVAPADPAALAAGLDRALAAPPRPPVAHDWAPWMEAVAP